MMESQILIKSYPNGPIMFTPRMEKDSKTCQIY